VLETLRLDGKTAVVTGSGRGLGQAMAKALGQAGAELVCAARTAEQIDQTARQITEAGGRAIAVPADVTDSAQVDRLVDWCLETYGKIDIMVTNAGGGGASRGDWAFWEYPDDAFESVLAINLKSNFYCDRAASRAMVERGEGGVIIGIVQGEGMKITAVRVVAMSDPVSPDDHRGQALVRQATAIPIASGEREFTRYDFQDLLAHGALDIAQPDVARAGGFTEIRRISALTSAHQVRLAPHAWGSGVLFAASIHVAMSAPNCHILEVSQGYMPMIWDLFNEDYQLRDGVVYAPDRPGLGFTLRADALERFEYIPGPEYTW